MPLPANVQQVLLHGRYVLLNGDPVFPGYVTFSSQIRIRNANADTIILPVSIRCDLDSNGEFTVTLPTTNDPDNIPDDWTYTVEEKFQSWSRVYGLKLPITLPQPPTVVEFSDLTTTLPDVVSGAIIQVDWVNVTGKPTTFTPSAHIHPVAEVNTLQTQLDAKAASTHNHDSSYSAVAHDHNSSYSPLSHSHIQGDVTGLEVALANKLDPGDVAIAPANDQSALTLRGFSGSQTAPVIRIQNHDGTFNILVVEYPSATFNVPINVPYFTVSNSFLIDGSGRRFYWSDADPDTLPLGIAPIGSIWIDGPNLVLKRKTSSGPEVWTAQTTGGPHTHVEADITDFAHTHSAADIVGGTIDFAELPTGTGSSQVAIGNHNHDSLYAPIQTHFRLSSDFTTQSTSATNVTGATITVSAIGTYEFRAVIFWSHNNITVGREGQLRWTGTASASGTHWFSAQQYIQTTAFKWNVLGAWTTAITLAPNHVSNTFVTVYESMPVFSSTGTMTLQGNVLNALDTLTVKTASFATLKRVA
jgi:hypothetical protein